MHHGAVSPRPVDGERARAEDGHVEFSVLRVDAHLLRDGAPDVRVVHLAAVLHQRAQRDEQLLAVARGRADGPRVERVQRRLEERRGLLADLLRQLLRIVDPVWPWPIELARSIPALGASELFFLGAEFLLGGAS